MSVERPTMVDVASRAGVSRALVSIVFRGVPGASTSTRQRVLAAADELGYQPDRRASRLGRTRTRMVGVVFSLGHDFHAEVVDGVYAAAEEHGYEVVLSGATARRSESRAVRAVLAERCEGAILIGPLLPTREIAELAARVPTVVLLRHLRLSTVDTVRTDEKAGVALLIDHLASLGHEQIVHLDGGRAAGAAQRRQAFRSAMSSHGLRPECVAGGLTEQSGAAAAALMLDPARDLPTAVAAFNDRCALGALHRFRQRGVEVPADVSLTGFDDIAAAGYDHIGLTTVRQDTDQLGARALERVRHRLEESAPPSSPCLVQPYLVVRRTTAQSSSTSTKRR